MRSRPRGRVLLSALGAGLLLVVPSAGASHVPGARYVGRHSASIGPYDQVFFSITADGRSVFGVTVVGVPGDTCRFGSVALGGLKIPIVDERFSYREGGVDFSGSFTGPQSAAGTFQDTIGPPDSCTSIRITWTATTTAPADTTPPETEIDTVVPAVTNQRSLTFSFTATEPDGWFRCRLDFVAIPSCASPYQTAPLADGTHVFDVAAIDTSGNADPTPASAGFEVDTTPPETTITAGPKLTASNGVARFWFRSSELQSTFGCRLDTKPWRACTSPARYPAPSPGRHVFRARATDQAGNPDRSPARRSFSIR